MSVPGWTRSIACKRSFSWSSVDLDDGQIETRSSRDDFRPGGIIIRGVQRNTPCSSLPEERICTWQRTERQLPEKVSRVADHPVYLIPVRGQPLAPLLSLSLSIRPSLSPLPLRSTKLKEPREGTGTCLEKFPGNRFPRPSKLSSLGLDFRKWTSPRS